MTGMIEKETTYSLTIGFWIDTLAGKKMNS